MKHLLRITYKNAHKKTGRITPGFQYRAKDGGAKRDRTVDLYAASVALSQLSYGPLTFKTARLEGGAFRHSLNGLST